MNQKLYKHLTYRLLSNKKQVVVILCITLCIGFSLLFIGVLWIVRNALFSTDSQKYINPDESASLTSVDFQNSSDDSLSLVSTAEPTATSAYPDNPFEKIASLDGICLNWGQGTKFDELNRPIYALSFQKEYADYDADFIKSDGYKDIYLTFDEGYENGYTAQILDVLKEKNVPAVFFVTEPYAKSSPDLMKRMINEGHVVGNHSVTHPSDGLPSLTLEEQKNEIMGCHDYVKENFNYTMKLFRFPSGKFSVQSLAVVSYYHYRSVFWSFAYVDYDVNNQMEEKKALELLTARLHPGAIYLLHAVSKTNADILGDFIDQARAEGYKFVTYE